MGGSALARDSRLERLPSSALKPPLLSHPRRASTDERSRMLSGGDAAGSAEQSNRVE
jgi:hypothetical protein